MNPPIQEGPYKSRMIIKGSAFGVRGKHCNPCKAPMALLPFPLEAKYHPGGLA